MTTFTGICHRLLLATCLLTPLAAAPVGVSDTYNASEDTILNSQGSTLVDTGFETPAPTAGAWQYLDKIKNDQGGQTPDGYPVDGSGRNWKDIDFDTATSTVGPWGSSAMPLTSGEITYFTTNGITTNNILAGIPNGGASPYLVSTYLFRKTFTLTATEAAHANWRLRYVVDDGAVIYINGVEKARYNLDAASLIPTPGLLNTLTTVNGSSNENQQTTTDVNLAGLLVAGVNVISVEVHQTWGGNYTSSDVGLDCQLTPLNLGESGFTYADNVFGTSAPDAYASGNLLAAGGNPQSNLNVSLSRPVATNLDVSGGWFRTFTLSGAATVRVTVDARLRMLGGFGTARFGLSLLSMDGVLYGNGTPPVLYLQQTFGQGAVVPDITGAWQTFSYDMPLASGDHTLVLGGFCSQPRSLTQICHSDFDNLKVTVLGSGGSVLANDTGGAVTAQLVATTTNGTLSLLPDGNFSYSPNLNFSGTDTFTYRAVDAASATSGITTVTINVAAVNDAPVGVSDSYSVNEGSLLNVPAATGVLTNDTDVDTAAGSRTASLVLAPPVGEGSVTLNANGSFAFTPAVNFSGSTSFRYRVSDGSLQSADTTVTINVIEVGASPVANADAYTTAKNTPLVVTALAASTVNEDVLPFLAANWRYKDDGSDQGTLWIDPAFDDSGWKTGAAELGYGDNDEATVVEDNPVAGYVSSDSDKFWTTYFRRTFTVSQAYNVVSATASLKFDDGGVVYLDGTEIGRAGMAPGTVTYLTPAASSNENVITDFAVSLSLLTEGDNTAAVEIHQQNQPSSDISMDLRIRLTRAVPAGVLANDTDADPGTTLTVASFTQPAHGTVTVNANGTFTYTPAGNYQGPDSFTYIATDGVLNSTAATVSLTVVNGPNVRPVTIANTYAATEDSTLNVSAALGVITNDTDADGDTLTALLISTTANGTLTLNPNGSFAYTPAANFTGADTFTYAAQDAGGVGNTATVTINVSNVNDAPVTVNDNYATDPNTPFAVSPAQGVLANDTDPDAGAVLTATLVTAPSTGAFSLSPSGSFSYNPPNGFNGTVTFTYRASDGVATSNIATATIRINGRPVAVDNTYAGTEDNALTISAPGVLSNDTDSNGDPLTAVLVSGPASGSLNLAANGGFTYTPAANFAGPVTFTYYANDGNRNSLNPATVTLNIAAVNDVPVASNDSYSTDLDVILNVSAANGVLQNDDDADNTSLTAQIVTQPANGTIILNADGSFQYIPAAGFTGLDSFTYRTTDGIAFSSAATVALNVGVDLSKVVINEIMFHPVPSATAPAQEFIEIYNGNPGAVDASGWAFNSGVNFTIPAGTMIPGLGYLVVAADTTVFNATYGSVSLLRGGWIGELSNSGERVRLVTTDGTVVDEVEYADQGAFAERRQSVLGGEIGWDWYTRADGGGSSMELIQPLLSNKNGANWTWSAAAPTPGNPNSAALSNIAPLISAVEHRPQIPRSTDSVNVTAELKDESLTAPTANLFWRLNNASPGAFLQVAMLDDGLHGDGLAGDHIFGGTIPPQPNGSVIEFYIAATDSAANSRTWPAPGRDTTGTYGQLSNAFYQVDEEAWTHRYPIYRLIGDTATKDRFLGAWNRGSDSGINVTLVAKLGDDIDVRYLSSLRVRGAGSRGASVNNWRLDIPSDNRWRNRTECNLNVWYPHLGFLASQLMDCSGLIHENAVPVQLRLNATNRAADNSAFSYGYCIDLQPVGGEYLDDHRPLDPGGNTYKKVRPHQNFTVREITAGVPSAAGYIGDGWIKGTNEDAADWTDMNNFMKVWNLANPTEAQLGAQVNIDHWCRWFAFQTIVNHNETNISNGANDDYGMYRGVTDPRFLLLAHDFDTCFGKGGNTSSPDPTPANTPIYQAYEAMSSGETLPQLEKFFSLPGINQRYKAQLVDLLNTHFHPTNFAATVENSLSDWTGPTSGILPATRQELVDFITARRTHILQTLLGFDASFNPPAALTAATSLTVTSGYPQTTSATATGLAGTVDSTRVRWVRINGVLIDPDNYNLAGGKVNPAPWSAGSAVTLAPGLNKVRVEALAPDSKVLGTQNFDIWYNDSSVTTKSGTLAASETWTAAGGPYQITASLTVPAGVILTIQPGTSVYLNSGVSITVNGTGRILAEGTANSRIRFTSAPGAGNWGALDFVNTTAESRLVNVDVENAAGTTLGGHAAKCHVNSSIIYIDNTYWGNTPMRQYISFDNSSFIVSNSTFPSYAGTYNVTSSSNADEMLHGSNGIPAGGYGIFRDNYFGHTWGFSDTIDFTGGNRPGAILQVINNIFDGATDDCLDLDSTDAWIEGNVFFGVHQDTTRTDPLDTGSAISGGQDNAAQSEWTILNNVFYDVDHVVLSKQNNRFSFVNNTVARVNKAYGNGVDIAAFNFKDAGVTLPALSGGNGFYVAGNVITDCPALTANYNAANITGSMFRNLFPAATAWAGPGSENVFAAAQLRDATLTPPAILTAGTPEAGRARAAEIRAALRPQPLSPALCTGLFGKDKGAYQAEGIAIHGEPLRPTNATTVTLALGPYGTLTAGTPAAFAWGYQAYKYSLDGGPLSAEIPISTPLTLTGLTAGTHVVSVIGKNDAGAWQVTPTQSRNIVVDPAARPVVINEVLAANINAWPQGALRPDYIELRNLSGVAVDLGGWGISDDPVTALRGPKYIFSPGTMVPANGYLLLDSTTLGFALNAAGDEVLLYSGTTADTLVDSIAFGHQVEDFSLGRTCTGLDWTLNAPTPGVENQVVQLASNEGVVINEWSAANDFIVANDFLELYNPAVLPVDISGLVLTDDSLNFPAKNPIVPFSYIGGGGFALFVADGQPNQGTNHLNFTISKVRETLALLSPAGQVLDHVYSLPQIQDVTNGRTTDGSLSITAFTVPTPGYSNATDLTAQSQLMSYLRITEMMYNPAGGASAPEYIELKNISNTTALDLGSVKFVNGITFQFAPGTTLAPGAFIVISSVSQAALQAVYPGAPFGGTYTGKLDNNGEGIRMEIDGYELGILDFSYDDIWYPVTDGGGAALEIVDALALRSTWGDKISWRATAPNPGLNGVFGVVAGEDITVCLPASASLEGAITYGNQNQAGVTLNWTKVSGPGSVNFSPANDEVTTASFSTVGTYVLRLTATGTLTVSDDVTVTVAESYDVWAQRVLGSSVAVNTLMTGDYDKDGISNMVEFALGTNAASGLQAGMPVASLNGAGFLTLTYTRYAGCGMSYVVEVSDDLLSWTSSDVVESMTSVSGSLQTWVAVDNANISGKQHRFIRVRIIAQ